MDSNKARSFLCWLDLHPNFHYTQIPKSAMTLIKTLNPCTKQGTKKKTKAIKPTDL